MGMMMENAKNNRVSKGGSQESLMSHGMSDTLVAHLMTKLHIRARDKLFLPSFFLFI